MDSAVPSGSRFYKWTVSAAPAQANNNIERYN